MEFTDRDAALAFIDKEQAGRRNLTPEEVTYALGKEYLRQKQPRGGDRSAKAGVPKGHRRRAEAMGGRRKGAATPGRRGAESPEGVDGIGGAWGAAVERQTGARQSGLTRQDVIELCDGADD